MDGPIEPEAGRGVARRRRGESRLPIRTPLLLYPTHRHPGSATGRITRGVNHEYEELTTGNFAPMPSSIARDPYFATGCSINVGIKNIRMRLIPITLCLLTMVACSKQKQPSNDIEKLEWQRLKVVQIYWEGERTNQLERFSDTLRQMSEPVYWNASTNSLSGHFYRFLWLRTFDKPVIVTIRSTDEGQVEIRRKIFSGQSGFGIGQIEQEVTTTNNSKAISTLMADLDRWLPYVPEFNGDYGLDGAMWMIDGIKDRKSLLSKITRIEGSGY